MADGIRQWLENLELGEYADVFEANAVDVSLLSDLDEADLEKLGVAALGHRKKMLRAIAGMSGDNAAGPATSGQSPPAHAERRLLTVMFCDLVGSTALSRQLDPEDLRDVMRQYQDAVAGSVTRYGGHVAKYLGDGVLTYFGWPQAFEDQAERAVRASLDAIAAVGRVHVLPDATLQARVGVATGPVVVGDLVGESGRDAEAVSGETPNLAARLQTAAEPGQIVVGDATRSLIGRNFLLRKMVPQHLKGFDDGVSAWLVLGEEDLGSRFEAARGARLSRFVGRDAELALLSERWQLAKGGEGQIVTITAEPGLGKSRLVETFLQQVETAPHSRFRYQCSPYHVNSALFPAIQELRLACGFTNEDADAAKLDKLEGMLARTGDFADDGAALLANLLALPGEDRYGQRYNTPEQIKRRTMDTIVERLLQHAAKTPVIALFEDAHWIDPTSVELLQLIADRTREAPLLMLVTHRPEWHFPLAGHDNLTSLKLNRLGKSQAAAIVRATAGDAVPDEIIVRIVARTDGVPLFVEELTKSLVEAGLDASSDDIPASLQASLLARLDRLGPEAKEAAQIGAVIGREITHALLKDVHEEAAENVDAALDDIVESGLMFRDGLPPNARYTFKHALVQDTAYGSLLKSRRLELHRKVARALEAAQNEPPELLAHHFTEAGLTEEALHYWLSAGRDAAARCNHREAISHLERGLALLETTPAGPERDRGEIEFRLVLGTPLGGRFGVASGELEANYLRVQELCRSDDETESLFPATWNLWLNSVMRGELRRSCSLADQVLVLGDRRNDVGLQIEAHHAQ